MAFLGMGKKKEYNSPEGMPMDMGMPPEQGYDDQNYAEQGYPPAGQDYGQYPQEAYPPEQYPQGTPMQQVPSAPPPAPETNKEQIEEVAEAIVEEKWKEKEREIGKVLEWKEEAIIKLSKMQQEIDDIKASFDSLHKGMLGKISEYDDNLTNVGTEIKSMEKVFSKVLPSLTDSVNKLQRMSDVRTIVKKK